MVTQVTNKKAYYRLVGYTHSHSGEFNQLVAQALLAQKKIKDRLETVDAGAKEFRFISSHKKIGQFLCGRLTTFERGGFQVVMNDDENAESLELSAIEPPLNRDGMQQQFVPGLLHFVIFKNHVAIIQSQALRASALEAHLAWLLRDKTSILDATQGFSLNDVPQKATKARIRKAHVKSVLFGRPLLQEVEAKEAKLPARSADIHFKAGKQMLQALQWFVNDDAYAGLGLKDEVFDGNLEVWIEIRYPKGSRSQSENSVRLLDNIAIALRDIEEDQARLQLTDGSVVLGKELKISSHIPVTVNEGLPDEDILYASMCAWVKDLIDTGTVSPD